MTTQATVTRWGSGLAVRIPNKFATARGIKIGTVIDLESIRLMKPRKRRYKLSELMARFKPEHRHGEWDLGDAVGKESW